MIADMSNWRWVLL